MQIRIIYKEDGKIKPYTQTRVYETPYIDGEKNDWMCGFELNDENECAFRVWHIGNSHLRQEKIKWFPRQDYSWDDYFKWLGNKVLRIEVDSETYFEDETIEEDEETVWTTTN